MLKVLIVDDEFLIRIGLKSTIQWEENGFVIIGDAENGEEAIKLYHEFQPDIVITDIRMPKMDGLELTRYLRTVNQDVKVVILSSHNDFAYAKEAITLGASDYILKASMEPVEILNTLIKVRKQIESQDKKEQNTMALKSELEYSKKLVMLKMFDDFIKGTSDAGMNEFSFQFPDFIVVCGRVDDYEEQYRKMDPMTKRLLRESILNIFQSKMNDACKGIVEEYSDGVFVAVLSVNQARYSCEDAGATYADAVQKAFRTYTKVSVSFGISKGICEINQIPKAVEETLQTLQQKIFYGNNCIITYKQSMKLKREIDCVFSCEEDKIRYYVLNNRMEAVESILAEIFQYIDRNAGGVIQLNYICTQYVSLLNRISIEAGFNREQAANIFFAEEPLGLESVSEIEEWFKNQFRLLAQSIGVKQNSTMSGLIREARKYIRLNYMNNIALGDVAEHVNISRIYFSQLFKQETGEKYIDFLNKVRIEKAKEYLAFYDMKTYEVAEKVGFQESGYFARTFKKLVGKTPSEYQKEVTSVMIRST